MSHATKIKLNVISSNQPVALDVMLALPDTPFRPADVPAFDRREQSFEGRPLRTSSYTIYVDLPGDAAHMLLVHGYTGAYDRVSRGVAACLKSLEKAAPRPLHGAWSSEAPLDRAAAPCRTRRSSASRSAATSCR